jgi:FMN phosphatase YigB (HAD superfamily)
MRIALFDLDNTLFDRAAAFRLWAERFALDLGLGPYAAESFVAWDDDGLADRHHVWSTAKEHLGLPESVDDLVSRYYVQYKELLTPDAEVQSSLGDLRAAGWRICIVTNGPASHQCEKADRLGLLPCVDGFCSSGHLGLSKPDRRIFVEGLRRAGAPDPDSCVSESWMVGDSPGADMVGARHCGLGTVWMHRDRRWDPDFGEHPDRVAGSVQEAVSHLLGH